MAPIEEITKATGLKRAYLNKACRRDFPERSIEKWLEKQYALARVNLRRIQFDLAENGRGSAKVAVWLGIQYLGQSTSVGILEKPQDAIPDTESQERKNHEFTGRNVQQALPAPKTEKLLAKTAPIIDAILVDEEKDQNSPKPIHDSNPMISAHTGEKIDG